MSYVRIITVSQDSRLGNGGRNQICRPIYTNVYVFLTWLREQTEFLSFRRWLD